MPHYKSILFATIGGLLGSVVFAMLSGESSGTIAEWEHRLASWWNGREARKGPAGG